MSAWLYSIKNIQLNVDKNIILLVTLLLVGSHNEKFLRGPVSRHSRRPTIGKFELFDVFADTHFLSQWLVNIKSEY